MKHFILTTLVSLVTIFPGGKDGTLKEVSERWITHPGDLGMKMIADLMIEKLGF